MVIIGDFNIDILKYNTNKDSSDFVDAMYSSFLLPYISSPTCTKSRTLIDNIFSNNTSDDTLSGNITTTLSDHYAQFLLIKNISPNKKRKK